MTLRQVDALLAPLMFLAVQDRAVPVLEALRAALIRVLVPHVRSVA